MIQVLSGTHENPIDAGQVDQWILGVAAGDTDCLARLYSELKGGVYGFALSYLKNAADAEDVLQDTFVRIWSSAGSYRPQGHGISWVMTIAKNLALAKLQSRKREASLEPEEWSLIPDDATDATGEDRLLLESLMKCLTQEEIKIVVLHAAAGLKHREIADLMELPLSTVLSKYHRSLKKLNEQLKGESSK